MDSFEINYTEIRGGKKRFDLYDTFFQLLVKWAIAGAKKEKIELRFIRPNSVEKNTSARTHLP